ncbi:hypothetical protein [Kribbella solani]|uniref:Uncharacterized protein n=1 Tax=Kribbella solani TaxID=236067 RepID=A0A841DYE0_9ACTN|nr:hypothetical protein [Kribbella solani]MBB5983672.1 hypothetical protein [Kribbella solani]MDX2969407.1 hypothetical protein [Kribbella solani]MDX3002936.1 hypothetical protein [Kribbella solani]
MITNTVKKPFSDAAALPCAQIQGASPRLHVATVVLMASGAVQIKGGAVGDVKYGGSGSRAWSPPV